MGENKYYFDIDSIISFIFSEDSNDNSSEITELYNIDETDKITSLVSKQINEKKNKKNESVIAIKYDLVKNLMSLVCSQDENTDISTIGKSLAFNSMLVNGFIKA